MKTHFRGSIGIAAVLATALVATRSPQVGDTNLYANQIVPYLGQAPGPGLWEFGHLLWRPLGWALTALGQPLLVSLTDWTPYMQVVFVLMALGAMSAVINVVLWYRLSLDIAGSQRVAWLVALGFAFGHGVLLYSHSGTSYVPGLACVSASLYAIRKGRTSWAGVYYALAAGLWFPYILAGAGLLLAAAGPQDGSTPWREAWRAFDYRQALRFVAAGGVLLLVLFGIGALGRGVGSLNDLRAWAADASHGVSQSLSAVRIGTGLPRSLLYLGRDGVLYRRFLFHDPYAPVGVVDLVQASLWKIAAFGLFVLALLWELVRKPGWMLVLLIAGALPVLYFALFLFEPGSPERYLPAMVFVLAAVAWVMRTPDRLRAGQWAMVGFLVCVAANNGYAFFAPRIEHQNQIQIQRVATLHRRLIPQSVVMIATNQDLLQETTGRLPFDPINRPQPLPLFDVLELANVSMGKWEERFAGKVLEVWAQGGQAWVSQRFWQAPPRSEWYWVEGERTDVPWSRVASFFAQLETTEEEGGEDGFRLLPASVRNRELLMQQQR